MASLGDLMVRVGAEIDPSFNSTMDGASGKLGDFADKATSVGDAWGAASGKITDVVPDLQQIGEATDRATESLKGMVEGLIQLGEALAVTEALHEFGEEALTTYANVQKASISLTALTGSSEGAEQAINALKGVAISDALSFPQLVQAYQRMTAFGFSSTQIPGVLQAVANAAAATDKPFEAVADAVDRMALGGNAASRQLASLGISLNDLGAAMGVAAAEAAATFKALDTGDRLTALSNALSKYGDVAKQVAGSISGQWQNLKTQTEFVFETVGQALAPVATQLMQLLSQDVLPFLQGIADGFNKLPTPIKDFAVVAGIAAAAIPTLTLAMSGLQKVIGAFEVINVTGWAADLAAVIPNVVYAIQNDLVGALTTGETALLRLGQAGGIAAAAFVGFELGKWAYDQVPGMKALGDSVADFLLKVPGVQTLINYLNGVTAANESLQKATDDLNRKLAITDNEVFQQAGESLEAFSARVRAAAAEISTTSGATDKLSASQLALQKAIDGVQQTYGGQITALVNAKANLEAVTMAYENHTASLGQLQAAQKGVEDAQVAMNPNFVTAKQVTDELNSSTKDLTASQSSLDALLKSITAPVISLTDAQNNLKQAQQNAVDSAAALGQAQENLSAAVARGVSGYSQQLTATEALKTAETNAKDAKVGLEQAQKDLTTAQKDAAQVAKDQAQTDSDYATMLNTLGKTALLSYADAIADVSAAKSKYVSAVTNEITIQAQLDALAAAGKQSTTDYANAQGALTIAHQQVAQALRDLSAAQSTANTSQAALSAATRELLTDQTALDALYKDHLTGDTTDLQTAVLALSTARQNEATAADALILAEGNLAVVKATATSSETDLKTATDNARIARENLTAATKNTADQEGVLVQQFGLSKTAAAVLAGATVSLTEVFKDMGLKSASSLQDLANVAQKEYTLIASSGASSANQVRDAQIKALQDQKAAYIANGSDLSAAQQHTLDTLLNQQSYFNQQHEDQWHALYTTVDSQVIGLSNKLVTDLFEGSGSFGKTALKALEDIGAAFVNAFIAPATKAVANFIANSLSNLGSAFSGIAKLATDTGSTVDLAFFGGAKAASGATGGIMSALSSATSSLSGIVNMVSGIAGAVAGIIGDIETAHSNTILTDIEKETARMAIYLGDQGGNSIQGLMWRLVNDIEFGEMEKALNIISADIDKVAGPFWAYGLDNLKAISSNTYWALQKLQEIDNKTGNTSGSVNVEGTDLSTVISALDIINNTLVAESQTTPWFQTALQNINNGVVACAGWLQGILNLFQSGAAKVGGATAGSQPMADLAKFVGANFTDLENWLFSAFGRSMALPALPSPEQIPSSLAGGTAAASSATGSSTAAASTSTTAHAQQSTVGPTTAAPAPDIISFLTAQFTTTDGILSKAGDGMVAMLTGANVMLASLGAGVRQVDASLEKIGVGILAAFGSVTASLKTAQELVSANENKILDQIVTLNARESQELSLMGLVRDAVGQFATMTANQLSELINVTKMIISVPASTTSAAFAGAAGAVSQIASSGGGHTFNFPNARITGTNEARQALDQAVNELRRRNRII